MRERDRETDRERDRETDRERQRETERETDTHRVQLTYLFEALSSKVIISQSYFG